MRIAIVDDDRAERGELSERVRSALERRCIAGTILEYEDGDSFLNAARAERFGLVFLDIYMKGMDGVAAARELRAFDPDCVLVFTTTSTDHALDGYRVRAFQYLVKPFTAAEVETLFDELSKRLSMPEKYIEVRTTARAPERLRLRDILWAENFQHRVHIHTAGGTTVSRMTFSELSAQLAGDDRFFVCGRGVLVNLEHVSDFDGGAFTLADGRQVPVSRSFTDKARDAFGEHLFRRRKGAAV